MHLTDHLSVPLLGVWVPATAVRERPRDPRKKIAYEKFILIYLIFNLSMTLDALLTSRSKNPEHSLTHSRQEKTCTQRPVQAGTLLSPVNTRSGV